MYRDGFHRRDSPGLDDDNIANINQQNINTNINPNANSNINPNNNTSMNPNINHSNVTNGVLSSVRNSFEMGHFGCEVSVNGVPCGETKSLRIINEFRDLYQQKMMQIDTIAGGDCTQVNIVGVKAAVLNIIENGQGRIFIFLALDLSNFFL